MASHYLFEPEFCNPASGWEKGQVEKNVQDARRRLWQPMPSFADLDALNAWLEARCIAQWRRDPAWRPARHASPMCMPRRWPSLMPLGRPFDGFVEHTKRVSPTCLVHFERNRYSVPASFANRPVSLRIYPERHRRGRRRPDPVRARPDHRALASPARAHDLRLAPLPGGDPAQAGRPAQRRALRRDAGGVPAAAGPAAQAILAATGRWWRSWPWCCSTTSRPCSARSSWRSRRRAHQDPRPQPPAPADRRQAHRASPRSMRRRRSSCAQEPKADVERYDALRRKEVRHAS